MNEAMVTLGNGRKTLLGLLVHVGGNPVVIYYLWMPFVIVI